MTNPDEWLNHCDSEAEAAEAHAAMAAAQSAEEAEATWDHYGGGR